MELIILATLLTSALASPIAQSLSVNDDGSYQFYYETGKDGGSHSRTETRNSDGVVVGKFSYEDPTGEIREVSYRADDLGYVANGDVSVKGAPKGQYPFVPDGHDVDVTSSVPHDTTVEEEKTQPQEPEPQKTSEPHEDETNDHDDIKDLSLEESTSDDARPEAFPAGFFLQKFQGLRRLPEPTKEDKPITEEAAKTENDAIEPEEGSKDQTANKTIEGVSKESNKAAKEMELFMKLRPFPSFAQQHWAPPAMFHQPVYVYSYQQPDSYGYHYFF